MIHQNFGLGKNRHRLTNLVVAAVFLLTATPVFAEFKPRDRKPASGYSRAGGSRGCSSTGIPLTQLAPHTFVGKTASTRPMLAWYMSSSQNVQLQLFEFDSANKPKKIGNVQEIPTKVGINTLKLPLSYPDLTVGKTYLWQLVINCDNDQILNHAEFTVVDPESLVKRKFSNTQERVRFYAENELWYEALEVALKATSNGKLGETGANLVKNLAESEMLTGSEVDIKNTEKRIEYLQQISSKN